jgi:hypothetical protein
LHWRSAPRSSKGQAVLATIFDKLGAWKSLSGGPHFGEDPTNLRLFSSKVEGNRQEKNQLKGLILAQSERWRRGLGMQVERENGLRFMSRAAQG